MKPINAEMVVKAERMAVLMVRFMLGTITAEEHDELDEWVAESDLNMRLFEEMTIYNIEKQLIDLINS
jgi:transmembrane sensor